MADCMAADLDLLDGGAVPVNMDKYLAVRYPHPATVLDYFDDPILVAEEPASIREADRRDRLPPGRGTEIPDPGRRPLRRAG